MVERPVLEHQDDDVLDAIHRSATDRSAVARRDAERALEAARWTGSSAGCRVRPCAAVETVGATVIASATRSAYAFVRNRSRIAFARFLSDACRLAPDRPRKPTAPRTVATPAEPVSVASRYDTAVRAANDRRPTRSCGANDARRPQRRRECRINDPVGGAGRVLTEHEQRVPTVGLTAQLRDRVGPVPSSPGRRRPRPTPGAIPRARGR